MPTSSLFAAPRKVATTATTNTTLAAGRHTPVNATSGVRTMTLPTGQREGAVISVEKTDSSTNAVTVSGNIRGAAAQSLTLTAQYEGTELMADAAGSWWPLSSSRPAGTAAAAVPIRFSASTATGGVTGSDRADVARTVTAARMRVATAPTGSALTVVVQRSTDGGSTWSTVTTLTIPANATTEAVVSGLSVAQQVGDLIRLNVTSVGSTTAATGVVVDVITS